MRKRIFSRMEPFDPAGLLRDREPLELDHDPDWFGFRPSFAQVILTEDVEKVVIHRANGVYTYWSEEVTTDADETD